MLIVDMPMPMHGCEDCPLLSTYMICRCDGKFRDLQKYVNAETRPEWCPIKGELPDEHGDLIDRQDAIKEFEPYSEYESNRRNADWVKRIKAVLNAMTPVIAAERKDDEQTD